MTFKLNERWASKIIHIIAVSCLFILASCSKNINEKELFEDKISIRSPSEDRRYQEFVERSKE